MPDVLVATPLKYSDVSRPYTFSDGISIRELSPILWDTSIAKIYVSEHERGELAKVKYWLCVAKEVEYPYGGPDKDLYEKAQHAMSALQIICPSGAKNIFLKFLRAEQGYENIGDLRPKELCNTLLGRIASLERQGLERDFEAVYAGVRRAFIEKIVRLQNPILLLGHGSQIGNVNLGALMFVMGLDVLFMAGDTNTFMKRVGGFLGLDSYVFPATSLVHRQPRTLVRDVLSHLYEFRNILAHGQEVPKQFFRQTYDLLSTEGERINYEDYYGAELMLESGLFTLTTALRKIFVEGLVDEVKDHTKWRVKMMLYEHRYVDSGGILTVKKHGR
ncbi:MAG TPA: hypothetical protein VMF91_07420 [Bryobacteraceae bacterium]|nr:hypothetical protein [Bryobacteraceae bacterium]